MSDKKRYTVMVADDHEIIRDAIGDLLERGSPGIGAIYELVAMAENGLETIAKIKAHKPDILFLDIAMPLAGVDELRQTEY